MIARYYKDKIWLEFEWTISWMIPLWFFVLLENSAEWMVNLENFLKQQNYKKYNFEDDILKLNFENNFWIFYDKYLFQKKVKKTWKYF